MHLQSIEDLDAAGRERLARVVLEGFVEHAPASWPTIESAREEIDDYFEREQRLSRVARLDDGRIAGWIAAHHAWGHAWEIHPLVVAPEHRGRGLGRDLVVAIEDLIWDRDALVIDLGTSDETNATTVGGIDICADPVDALASFRCLERHAAGFWLRMDYALVGFVPDAEGPGKPTIRFAKTRPASVSKTRPASASKTRPAAR